MDRKAVIELKKFKKRVEKKIPLQALIFFWKWGEEKIS
jgi:hypothetical protein